MAKTSPRTFRFVVGGEVYRISLACDSGLYHGQLGERRYQATIRPVSSHCLLVDVEGRSMSVYLAKERGIRYISVDGRQFQVEEFGDVAEGKISPRAQAGRTSSALVSPMPGQVVKIEISQGETVAKGQILAIVEAMKMENELRAPGQARVKRICAAAGELVDAGQVIVELELGEKADTSSGS